MTDTLTDRLGGLRIEIDADTRARHLAAVESELRSPSPIPPRRYRPRRRLTVVVLPAVLLVALTAAGAFAAESSLPGDRLYPVKQATEWVRSWIDPALPADHRVDELEQIIDLRAERDAILDQLKRAESAVIDAIDDDVADRPLVERLDRAWDRIPPELREPEVAEPERDIRDPVGDGPVTTIGDETPIDEPPVVDEPARPPLTEGDTERPRPGDRDEDLATLCQRVAASHDRAEEFPAWLLRRCRHILRPSSDLQGFADLR